MQKIFYQKNGKLKKVQNLINLIEKKKSVVLYQLTKEQVEAILELRLQKLTAYGIGEIHNEITKLSNLNCRI